MKTSPIIKHLGIKDYAATYEAMRAHNRASSAASPDEIWLLEHPPVFTQGLAGKAEHILDVGDIPVVKVNRGGQVTYHGPGQLVVYLLLNMHNRPYGVKNLVHRIEQSVIDLLAEYGVVGVRQTGMPGVYVARTAAPIPTFPHGWGKGSSVGGESRDGQSLYGAASSLLPPLAGEGRDGGVEKIAAIGLRVANHATYHGLALNVDMDLAPFDRINPCGYVGQAVTQLSAFGVRDNVTKVGNKLTAKLKEQLYG